MKITFIAAAIALGLLAPAVSQAAPLCPVFPFAVNTDCNIVLTIGPGGALSTTAGASTTSTYDGVEDVIIGVINNSGGTVNSINIASSTNTSIYGFDGDGIDTYGGTSDSKDTSGYGGPIGYFTNINGALTSGTLNFDGGLANGGFTYFSLEEAITFNQIVVTSGPTVPEPSTLLMMGTGIAGFAGALRRKFAK